MSFHSTVYIFFYGGKTCFHLIFHRKNTNNTAELHVHSKPANLYTKSKRKTMIISRRHTLLTILQRIIDSSQIDNRLNWTHENINDDTRWGTNNNWMKSLTERTIQGQWRMKDEKIGVLLVRTVEKRTKCKCVQKQKGTETKKTTMENTLEEIWGNTWTFYKKAAAVQRQQFDAHRCRRHTHTHTHLF